MARQTAGWMVVGAVLVCTPAFAFTETQVGKGAPSAAPAQSTPAPAQSGVQLGTPDDASKDQKGTEVRIPGLGKLGVLPKLDFGLDILYGASDDKRREEPPQSGRSEDMTVHGTIKHKF